jgi:hypothetical protein
VRTGPVASGPAPGRRRADFAVKLGAFRPLGAASLIVAAVGCGPAFTRPVSSVAALKPNEKIVVCDFRIEGGDISDWVPGLLTGAQAGFADGLPGTAHRSGSGPNLKKDGGIFFVAVPADTTVFLSGISASSTNFVQNMWTHLPFEYELPKTGNQCEYVGTFMIRKEGDRIFADVLDLYDRDKHVFESYVAGCDLRKSIATEPSEAAIMAWREELARQRAKQREDDAKHFGGRFRSSP